MRILIDCEKAKEFAALLAVDGHLALNENERDSFDAHVSDCGECAAFYEQMGRELVPLMDEIRGLPQIELPTGFHEEVMEKLKAHQDIANEDVAKKDIANRDIAEDNANQEIANQDVELPDTVAAFTGTAKTAANPWLFFRRFSAAAAAVVVLALFSVFVVNIQDWFDFGRQGHVHDEGQCSGFGGVMANGELPAGIESLNGEANDMQLMAGGEPVEGEQRLLRVYDSAVDFGTMFGPPSGYTDPVQESAYAAPWATGIPVRGLLEWFEISEVTTVETTNYTRSVYFATEPARLTAVAYVDVEVFRVEQMPPLYLVHPFWDMPEFGEWVQVLPRTDGRADGHEERGTIVAGAEFVLEAGVYVVMARTFLAEAFVIVVE